MRRAASEPSTPAVDELLELLGEEYRVRLGGSGRLARPAPRDYEPPVGAFFVIPDRDGHALAGGGLRASAPGIGALASGRIPRTAAGGTRAACSRRSRTRRRGWATAGCAW